MAARKNYIVSCANGKPLNLRKEPSKGSKILSRLPNGSKVKADNSVECPDGWLAVDGGGYVMMEFLK